MRKGLILLSSLSALSTQAFAQMPAPSPSHDTATASAPPAGVLVLKRGTMISLMVVNEVSTKVARAGDRFVLRVNSAVVVDGKTVIPVGAQAWGEVLIAHESGAVGKAGRLSAKLLYIDLPSGRIPLIGEQGDRGTGGAGSTVFGVIAFGVFGLLTRGTNAKLKAGDLMDGCIAADILYDPAGGSLLSASEQPLLVGPSYLQT